ncbi:hypothetical protein [Micrococcus terreus]|uniref:hypothetical protein n=1 Tax=Micrococcus terreus TaxID=574650 RepID=UPI0030160043
MTESIDQAILHRLHPLVDRRRIITVTRQLPLDGRRVMLIVDSADDAATAQQMRTDAEATAHAMITERRTGMLLERLAPGTDRRPRLDPGWIVLTVMLPSTPGQQAKTVLEVGEGVGWKDEGSAQRIEQSGRDLRADELRTDGLVQLVTTAVEETTPPDRGVWASLTQGRWIPLAGVVLLLVAIAVISRLLQRRRIRAVTAHRADPRWYASAGADPALRLRQVIEALALALDAPHARALPSARPALTTIVQDTLELDQVAPRSRTGHAAPPRRAGAHGIEERLEAALQLLAQLIREGAAARPRVDFPDDVHQVLHHGPGTQGESGP